MPLARTSWSYFASLSCMASFCCSASSASHFLCGHWRSSLFKFLRWVFFFWLHWQPRWKTLWWFDCSVPFTGSSSLLPLLSVVWSLHVLFFGEMLIYHRCLKSDVLTTSCWTENPSLTLSFTEAITVMLLSQDKVAELPQRSVCFHFHLWPNGN